MMTSYHSHDPPLFLFLRVMPVLSALPESQPVRPKVAIKERTIPKTTSGKIQRRRTRTLLHGGGLEVVGELSQDSSAPRAAANVVAPAAPAAVRGSRGVPKKAAGKRRPIAPAPPSDESTEAEEAFPLEPQPSSPSRHGESAAAAAATASTLPGLGLTSRVSGGSPPGGLEVGAVR